MNSTAQCPQCGRQLPADAPRGVCPQCLLIVGMEAKSQADTLDRPGSFTPPKPHQLAQHFPQLEILDLIGHGGMGAVYKARQRGLDRMVALKILPPEVANDPAFEERFAREARALARLSHPNIVGVHDSGMAGGLYYVLMEYVDGIDLREAIQTNELTPAEALAIVPQICEALQYAHDEGVVHRDIKPENILLDKKGRVKIADFGLARLLGKAADNFTLTGTNQIMGTPKYMAPEQMEGSHEVDHRADIYSLGVVFYEMLTGELPLGRFDAPSHKVQLDVRVDEIVLRTLQKEPDRRYQAASDIKNDIETISGAAQLPPHVRRMFGYEYRSKTEIFGWPLLHVTSGIDPKTGRKRIAKGIIAIGDVAIGGLACGGVSLGVFSFGGLAIGLFALGGGALGLLVALGGGAIGLGFSVGGLAVGSVAIGGLAVGYYGLGGVAIAVHGISGMGRDPTAERFFGHWGEHVADTGILIAFVIPLLAVGSCLVISTIVAITKRASQQRQRHREEYIGRQHSGGAGCVVAVLLLVLMAGSSLILGLVFWVYFARNVTHQHAAIQVEESSQRARVATFEADRIRAEAQRRVQSKIEAGDWDLTDQGPVLNSYGKMRYHLDSNQVSFVNRILQSVHHDYLKLEQQHLTRETDELGHLVITINKFSEQELADLEGSLWSQMDEILDVDQQGIMRRNFRNHPGDGKFGTFDGTKWSLLGWGRGGARIEMWQVGTWFHWKARIVAEPGSFQFANRGPELPDLFKRFWNLEADTESTIDSPGSGRQE